MTDTLPQWRITPDQEAHNRLWIAALRSGQYQQTFLRLHRIRSDGFIGYPAGHCCLGVACETAVAAGVPVIREVRASGLVEAFGGDGGDSSMPPDDVERWLGLTGAHIETLISLNDTDRKTFDEIADVIEGWLDEALIESEVPC